MDARLEQYFRPRRGTAGREASYYEYEWVAAREPGEAWMIAVVILVAAFVAYILAKLKVLPKRNWMDIGFGLAALAAIIELVFPR